MGASNYLSNNLIDYIFGKAGFTPTNLWVLLSKDVITASDTGTSVNEADYTGYARVSTTPADWSVNNGSGENNNLSAIVFPASTGVINTIKSFAVVDAATLGNIYIFGNLPADFEINVGQTPRFQAGTLTGRVS